MNCLVLTNDSSQHGQFSAEHRRKEQALEAAFESDHLGLSTTDYESFRLLDQDPHEQLLERFSFCADDLGSTVAVFPTTDTCLARPVDELAPVCYQKNEHHVYSDMLEQSQRATKEACLKETQQVLEHAYETSLLSYGNQLQSDSQFIHDLPLKSPLSRPLQIRFEEGMIPRQKSSEAVLSTVLNTSVTMGDNSPAVTSRKVGASFPRPDIASTQSTSPSSETLQNAQLNSPHKLRIEIDDMLCSSIVCGSHHGTPMSSSSSLDLSSPMPHSLGGYTGQFDVSIPPTSDSVKQSRGHHTFGMRSHPNGLISHTRFIRDHIENNDFPNTVLDPTSTLSAILHLAHEQSCRAALQERFRTKEESIFRRELHRECTIARLEGIAVGSYRYFLGFQTVEDYIAANICVCWDECWCNKICTRFGDVKCPCSKHLIIEDQEAR